MHDGVGHLLGAEHGREAGEGDVRGDEEDCRGERDAEGRGEVLALAAQHPAHGRAEQQGDGGQPGGEAERGEGGAGEVEEVRHREGVVADGAVGEEGADVGHEGEGAGVP